ncbi:MAG TPA: type I methionyl aminopeptidase [Candidatus Paceibacterota bacterium]|jgi:methionyl aminopeptidase|nr:type I methionyl aminopeptidase [Candidatus Paceibacterota bacterium]
MLTLKKPEEIKIMAEAGRRLAEVLDHLAAETRAGVKTLQLDRIAYQMIHKLGAKPAFLRYKPAGAARAYPYTLCASLNSVVVHGQPSEYVIQDGDLVKLDLGLSYKGFFVDAARTVGVGAISKEAKRLMGATQDALAVAIGEARVGKTLGDIGAVIEKVARKNKCAVVDGLTGHGIGRALHEDPTVWNVGKKGEGEPLREGMVLAIEPMFAAGAGSGRAGLKAVKQMRDESWATVDSSLAAHFEHTVAITAHGPEVLTLGSFLLKNN